MFYPPFSSSTLDQKGTLTELADAKPHVIEVRTRLPTAHQIRHRRPLFELQDSAPDRSLRAVDIAPMVDAVDVDDAIALVDPVDHPVRAYSCRMPAFKIAIERMPDPVRLCDQPTEAELDAGSDDAR